MDNSTFPAMVAMPAPSAVEIIRRWTPPPCDFAPWTRYRDECLRIAQRCDEIAATSPGQSAVGLLVGVIGERNLPPIVRAKSRMMAR